MLLALVADISIAAGTGAAAALLLCLDRGVKKLRGELTLLNTVPPLPPLYGPNVARRAGRTV